MRVKDEGQAPDALVQARAIAFSPDLARGHDEIEAHMDMHARLHALW